MSETMIERVARAIYEGRNGAGCKPWSRLPSGHKAPYLGDAEIATNVILPEAIEAVEQAWSQDMSYPEARVAIEALSSSSLTPTTPS